MPHKLIQSARNSVTSISNITVTPSSTLTKGNCLIIVVWEFVASFQTITNVQDQSNTVIPFSVIGSGITSGSNQLIMAVCQNLPAGITSVKVTVAGTCSTLAAQVVEFSGIKSTSAINTSSYQAQAAVGTTINAISSGLVTPTDKPALLFAATRNASGGLVASTGTGFTSVGQGVDSLGVSEYRRILSTDGISATFTAAASANDHVTGAVVLLEVPDGKLINPPLLKFRPVKQNRLMSLLVSETAFTENVSLDYFQTVAFKPTYRLTLDTRNFVATIYDPTTRDITLDKRTLTLTANAATLTKFDSIATATITLEPSAGWAYFDVTAVSTDERSIFYSQTASIGNQVAYQTSTTTGQTVSIATNGFVTVAGTGLGTFNFRIFNGTSWSSEYTFEVNPTISITTADIDNQITVAQTAATLSGTNLILADAARVRYGTARLDMQSYSPATSPTFNVPTLTDFFNSGMPLGSVTFELLRAS